MAYHLKSKNNSLKNTQLKPVTYKPESPKVFRNQENKDKPNPVIRSVKHFNYSASPRIIDKSNIASNPNSSTVKSDSKYSERKIHSAVQSAINNKDKRSLQYIMVDAPDVGRTRSNFAKEYLGDYHAIKKAGLFDKYDDSLGPISKDKNEWDRGYYIKSKRRLLDNFSRKRLLHLVQIRNHLYNKGILK